MRVILSLLLGAAVANGATSFSDLSLEFQVSADVFEGEAHELLFHQASSPVPPSRDEGKWTEIVMLGNQKFSCVSGSESPRTPNLEFREMLVDQAARVSQLAVAESFLLKESPPGPCLLNVSLCKF